MDFSAPTQQQEVEHTDRDIYLICRQRYLDHELEVDDMFEVRYGCDLNSDFRYVSNEGRTALARGRLTSTPPVMHIC